MKKDEIFSPKEWDEIIDNAFSSDENHVFSEKYNKKKMQMERGITMSKNKKSKKRLTVLLVAAATAVIIPTSVVAYNTIMSGIEKTAKYQNTVSFQTPEASEEEDLEKGYKHYEFGWLPEGYTLDENSNKHKYKNEATEGGIYVQFYRLPDGKSIEVDFPFSEKCENYQSDGKTAVINYRVGHVLEETARNQRNILISFNDTPYVVDLTISNDISNEDMLKLIDNTKLITTDELLYGDYIPWLDENNDSPEPDSEYEKLIDSKNMYSIGETISYPFTNSNDGYEVTLNSIEFTDSFEGITTDGCGWEADFSQYMDSNGNILENFRQEVKTGDGVNTIDEIVSEEKLPMHILKINTTIKNIHDSKNEICVSPSLFIMQNGKPETHWVEGYDSILGYEMQGSHFSLATDAEHSKNNLILEPGESADVQLAFFVDDNVKDELFIDFHISGGGLAAVDFGSYFDLRQ